MNGVVLSYVVLSNFFGVMVVMFGFCVGEVLVVVIIVLFDIVVMELYLLLLIGVVIEFVL